MVLQNALDQVERELPPLCKRFALDVRQTSRLTYLFKRSLRKNAARMNECLEAPFVEALSVSEELWHLLGEIVVGNNTMVEGLDHVASAIDFMRRGGNVLLVQNHTSGADTLVLHHVVNQHLDGEAQRWLHMAGHVVNIFLLPLAITAGVHRIQIFSAKYCAQADKAVLSRMKENNARALASIGPKIMAGGQCIVLYPEGGRGDGHLKQAEPRTMKIPQLMSIVSTHGLRVLPSYVEATELLPVERHADEFERFLRNAKPGRATLRFGPSVNWQDLQPTDAEVRAHLRGHFEQCLGNPDHALKKCLADKVMRMIAVMTPESARGHYTIEGE